MKRYLALILLIAVTSLVTGCRGTGSSAPAPTNVVITAGDSSVTITWDMTPGVEYWIFKAATADITPQNCLPLPECAIIVHATSPYIVAGLTNGTTYSFTINGRIDGGKGGAGTASISRVPRLAGATWTTGTAMSINAMRGITFGTLFAAVGDNGALFSSTDGLAWNAASNPVAAANMSAASYYNSNYVAVGAAGVILTSPDAATWTSRTTAAPAKNLFAISNYGVTGFVATGASGTIIQSTDGITWNLASSTNVNPLNDINGVTYGNGKYVAVGVAGTLLTSSDGINWTSLTSATITSNTLNGIAYAPPAIGTTGTGTFVAVGANGTIVRSIDGGSTWAPIITSPFAGTTLINAITYGRQFIAVAEDGSIFTSVDGSAWASTTATPANSSPVYAVTRGLYDYTAVGAAGLNMHSK